MLTTKSSAMEVLKFIDELYSIRLDGLYKCSLISRVGPRLYVDKKIYLVYRDGFCFERNSPIVCYTDVEICIDEEKAYVEICNASMKRGCGVAEVDERTVKVEEMLKNKINEIIEKY